jgi:hypothetical protein
MTRSGRRREGGHEIRSCPLGWRVDVRWWRSPDLLVRAPGGPLELTSAEFVHDPDEQRSTVERLLELDFAILCTSHGIPVTDDPRSAIRAALGEGTGTSH